MKATKIDPILVSVLTYRFSSICEEMGNTMLRTARSTIMSEARDFVTAIFDYKTRLIAQKDYLPALAGASPYTLRWLAKHFEGRIDEGDIFILNDPYLAANNHTPDVFFAKPVFYNHELVFWTTAKAHQADLGGLAVVGCNPWAYDIWCEGLRIPALKLWEKGVFNQQIWDLIIANTRVPFLLEGDLMSEVGACKVGERYLLELCEKHGIETLNDIIDDIIASSEREVRDKIRQMPKGTFYAESKFDNDAGDRSQPFTVRLKLMVEDDSITIDWTGTDPQAVGFINSTMANTISCSLQGVWTVLGIKRITEGSWAPFKVIVPEGTVLNPRPGAAHSQNTTLGADVMVDAVWKALSNVIPDMIYSGWSKFWSPYFQGFDPRTGRPFAMIPMDAHPGGAATKGVDGWESCGPMCCMAGMRFFDPEMESLVYPWRVLESELWPESAGGGQWRGGYGGVYSLRCETPVMVACISGQGCLPETVAQGLFGGKPGGMSQSWTLKTDGRKIYYEPNRMCDIKPGDIYYAYKGGGGGFGDPHLRPAELVHEEVLDELMSIETAREVYGVAIDPVTLELNREETNKLRGK